MTCTFTTSGEDLQMLFCRAEPAPLPCHLSYLGSHAERHELLQCHEGLPAHVDSAFKKNYLRRLRYGHQQESCDRSALASAAPWLSRLQAPGIVNLPHNALLMP